MIFPKWTCRLNANAVTHGWLTLYYGKLCDYLQVLTGVGLTKSSVGLPLVDHASDVGKTLSKEDAADAISFRLSTLVRLSFALVSGT